MCGRSEGERMNSVDGGEWWLGLLKFLLALMAW